jgi:leader peptidase (prepilin peptidase)/N-methyltransferase
VDATSQLVFGPIGLAFATVWGAIWGSFFNVVIARLPLGRSVVHPPSSCFACGTRIRAFDNVPVLSYVWLRGRCRACGAPFSARYPLVEALTAALAAGLWWAVVTRHPALDEIPARLARFSLYFAFVGVLVVLGAIDLDTKRLPDVLTIPGAVGLFLAGFAVRDVAWSERAIGAAAGYLFVRLIADFYYYVLKREGLGLGDGKLLALIGAVLGWQALAPVIFLGSVLGTLVAVPVLLIRRGRGNPAVAAGETPAPGEAPPAGAPVGSVTTSAPVPALALRHTEVPFGPFLATAALVYLFAYLLTGDSPARWLWPRD